MNLAAPPLAPPFDAVIARLDRRSGNHRRLLDPAFAAMTALT
jgi:hypothetical protein